MLRGGRASIATRPASLGQVRKSSSATRLALGEGRTSTASALGEESSMVRLAVSLPADSDVVQRQDLARIGFTREQGAESGKRRAG